MPRAGKKKLLSYDTTIAERRGLIRIKFKENQIFTGICLRLAV